MKEERARKSAGDTCKEIIALGEWFSFKEPALIIKKEGIKMLTVLFIICMFAIFGKVARLAFMGAWGLTKILISLVFFPIILIGMVFSGLVVLALPVLIIFGIAALAANASS